MEKGRSFKCYPRGKVLCFGPIGPSSVTKQIMSDECQSRMNRGEKCTSDMMCHNLRENAEGGENKRGGIGHVGLLLPVHQCGQVVIIPLG